jgi:phosphopantetheinyl transferase
MLGEKGISQQLELDKDEFGKPYLVHQDQEISISHCKKYSAAIAGNRAVGIDIEHIGNKINRIADRFMHPSEDNGYKDQALTEYRYLIWCAKEAVYKLYGRKAVDFKNHMRVKPFALSLEGSFELVFQKHEPISYSVQYRIFDQHAMAWVIA